jgi:A118 family predicted phage portal protein
MSIISNISNLIKGMRKTKTYQDITEVLPYKNVLSTEMRKAIDKWEKAYKNKAYWLGNNVQSYNLCSFICSEIARMVTLEMKVKIVDVKDEESENNTNNQQENIEPTRAEFLQKQLDRYLLNFRERFEKGVALGGFYVKPYVDGSEIMCCTTLQGDMSPKSYDEYNNITEGTFYDSIVKNGIYYTRLEEHTKSYILDGNKEKVPCIHLRNRAFMSENKDVLGTEIDLHSIPEWQDLEAEADFTGREKPLFATFRVPLANNIDMDSPLGISIFSRALDHIKQADIQYSRILWEYEGSELAIDADITAMQTADVGGRKKYNLPVLRDRLFRNVNLDKDDLYNVFSPQIRDSSLFNGLNHWLMCIEDDCGLARGTLSESSGEAKTATELKILRQRSYATVTDNQKALKNCIEQIVDIMNYLADVYKLAPKGKVTVSIDFDDSIVTDKNEQLNQSVLMKNLNIISDAELRALFKGESIEEAQENIQKIQNDLNKRSSGDFEEEEQEE